MGRGLYEVARTKQVAGEPRRRWFASDALDLVVWFADDDSIAGFQLCYDKPRSERALTYWVVGDSLTHTAVDDGESDGLAYKATPVLIRDGAPDPERILRSFLAESADVPMEIRSVVIGQLESLARRGASPG
jgi:hypothetical protein